MAVTGTISFHSSIPLQCYGSGLHRIMLPRECKQVVSLLVGPILETPEELLEPTTAWTVPSEQLSGERLLGLQMAVPR